MQNTTILKLALGISLGFQGPAVAGPDAPVAAPDHAPSHAGNWCSWLKDKPGILYQNPENPCLQELRVKGMFQYQSAYVEGHDVHNTGYNATYDEYRRVRIGVSTKFLQYFGSHIMLDMVDDSRNASGGGDLDWGYADFYQALLTFDLGKALGGGPFDSLMFSYGLRKLTVGHETRRSAAKLLTVERSAIANKLFDGSRPTGLSVEATSGAWSFASALYSSTTDGEQNQAPSGWQDGVIYDANAGYRMNDRLTLGADFVYNDADVAAGQDSVMDYSWATSLNAQYDVGAWGVIGDFIYGDNGGSRLGHTKDRGGDFWGVVVMPYYWLVQDKLRLVGQYQFQGSSEAEGVRVNSRYGRADGITHINSGRGDSHHSIYGGLNYHLCGHNAKIQGGIEYQTMDTPDGGFDSLTYVLAFRSTF